jgi:hypothetical protein
VNWVEKSRQLGHETRGPSHHLDRLGLTRRAAGLTWGVTAGRERWPAPLPTPPAQNPGPFPGADPGIKTWRNLAPRIARKVRAELDLKTDGRGLLLLASLVGPDPLIQPAGGIALGDAPEEPVAAGTRCCVPLTPGRSFAADLGERLLKVEYPDRIRAPVVCHVNGRRLQR